MCRHCGAILHEYSRIHKVIMIPKWKFEDNSTCIVAVATQLLEVVHDWAHTLERRSSSHVVFLDFSKAFDTVPHERLLMKLDNIGVRGELLSWLRSFLVKRRQRVMANGSTSDWATVSSGVPQGSILGPLLFLIYTKDIRASVLSRCRTFADDCAIYREVNVHHRWYKNSSEWPQWNLSVVSCMATPTEPIQMQGTPDFKQENVTNSNTCIQSQWSIPGMGGLVYLLGCGNQ